MGLLRKENVHFLNSIYNSLLAYLAFLVWTGTFLHMSVCFNRFEHFSNTGEDGLTGEKGREHIHVLEASDPVDPLFLAAVGGAIAAAVSLSVFGFTFAWYTWVSKEFWQLFIHFIYLVTLC